MGALVYLSQDSVKQKMACSIKKINRELETIEKDAGLNPAKKEFKLKEQHAAYIAWTYNKAIKKVESDIKAAARNVNEKLELTPSGHYKYDGKEPVHTDDVKYITDLINDNKSLPKLDAPTEKDAKNCDVDDDEDDEQPPKKKQKTN